VQSLLPRQCDFLMAFTFDLVFDHTGFLASFLPQNPSWREGVMPRPKTYVVTLTDEQRVYPLGLLRKGEAKAQMLTQARILLLSAEGKTDRFIADVLQVTPPDGMEHPKAVRRGRVRSSPA